MGNEVITGKEIINLQQYTEALRSTGYKNIESAVAEIVDNSFEANATDVFIIVKCKPHPITGYKHVYEIAFLDNGRGMDRELVQSCLRIGYGTRTDRKGMGRFGVGLPQSSLHVCPLVEVYSWQNNSAPYKSYLDIEKIKIGEQKEMGLPENCDIPSEYISYLEYNLDGCNYNFNNSGTMVLWKNCDNVSPKTISPLFDRLEFALGKKFRYWIHEGKRNIHLINLENPTEYKRVLPNDPLLLMGDNLFLGNLTSPGQIDKRNDNYTEPLFEPFTNETNKTGIVNLPIKYLDKKNHEVKESMVTLKFSIARKELYAKENILKDPGTTQMGKYAKKLEGISVVRANREIDFGKFDFYDSTNSPTDRWWGCEINFNTELDEVFGVANNKQHVELIELDPQDYEDDEVTPVWFQIKNVIIDTISEMRKRNSLLRDKARAHDKESFVKETEKIINSSEKESSALTESDEIRKQKNIEEVKNEAKSILEQMGKYEPTVEEIDELLLNKVNVIYKRNNRAPFFDYETSLGICKCIINTDHIFYENFMFHIVDNEEARTAFELFIASLIRARDELIDDKRKRAFNDVIDEWNAKLNVYIKQLTSDEN
jgi:hypothetical protein